MDLKIAWEYFDKLLIPLRFVDVEEEKKALKNIFSKARSSQIKNG